MNETDDGVKKKGEVFSTKSFLVWLLLINPLALIVAVWSGGVGHGDYFLAKILYPYTMLSTHLLGDMITLPFAIFALLQMPIYGSIFSFSVKKHGFMVLRAIVVICHLAAVFCCFHFPMPNFS